MCLTSALIFCFFIILWISVFHVTMRLLCDQLRKQLNYLVCFNKVSSITHSSFGVVRVNLANLPPQALWLAGTHISHFVAETPIPPKLHCSSPPHSQSWYNYLCLYVLFTWRFAGRLFGALPRGFFALFKGPWGDLRQADNELEKSATVDWTEEFIWNTSAVCCLLYFSTVI